MSDERAAQILDAAYTCFTKHGVRRTTMDDIAAAAGVSRPAVYQYVRNKDDAFRRVARRLFDHALATARTAATGDGTLADRLTAVCAAKLALTQQLWQDSPHAAELLATADRLGADGEAGFTAGMHAVLTAVLTDAAAGPAPRIDPGTDPGETAGLLLALTRGLEADLSDPRAPRRRLAAGVALITAGLARPHPLTRKDPA